MYTKSVFILKKDAAELGSPRHLLNRFKNPKIGLGHITRYCHFLQSGYKAGS